jgi:hypothetical protein
MRQRDQITVVIVEEEEPLSSGRVGTSVNVP